MQDINLQNITTDNLSLPIYIEKKVEVNILRLDKVHPQVSGNKWFKLRFYLEEARTQGKKTIVTFGGAWSNHILATAAACKINSFNCIGIIRGEEPALRSETLLQAKKMGMQLVFISREEYRQQKIPEEFNSSDYYVIQEGGYGPLGAKGGATILDSCNKEIYSHIVCAAGTGTMTAGLLKGASRGNQVISISILKNNFALEEKIKLLTGKTETTCHINHDYHFGGYAKKKSLLINFMNEFYYQTGIPADFVYTGKLFFAVNDMIRNNFYPPGSNLLIIHSGGLAGNASLSKGTLIF